MALPRNTRGRFTRRSGRHRNAQGRFKKVAARKNTRKNMRKNSRKNSRKNMH
jgi:hypothetical protein